MYHFYNFGQSLKFRGGADSCSWESHGEGAQIGGKGLIAFRGRVRTKQLKSLCQVVNPPPSVGKLDPPLLTDHLPQDMLNILVVFFWSERICTVLAAQGLNMSE